MISEPPPGEFAAVITLDYNVQLVPFRLELTDTEQLHMMYELLNCRMVQAVNLDPATSAMPEANLPEMTLWIDEEGKFQPRPFNPLATWLSQQLFESISRDDYICGPALLTGGTDADGDTLPLDPASITFLISVADVLSPEELPK